MLSHQLEQNIIDGEKTIIQVSDQTWQSLAGNRQKSIEFYDEVRNL